MPVRVANDHDHPAGVVEPRDRLSFANQEHLRSEDVAEAVPRLAGGDRRLGPELEHQRLARELQVALDAQGSPCCLGAGLAVAVRPG